MSKSLSRDPNKAASRTVKETAKRSESPRPVNIQAAWRAWARGVGKVDGRGMLLLKAAFEAGAAAARSKRI